MIVINIELWPLGREEKKKHLGTIKITNDGTGTQEWGNYDVTLSRKGSPNSVLRKGRVEGFKRLKYGAYELLGLALNGILYDRLKVARKLKARKHDNKDLVY